ncbi:MAG: PKD domain-containing protein, partial [Flavobacteriaceae bacterium]
VSFTLIDADLDVDLFDLSNGQQINSTITQGKGLNIRANTNPSVVGSVNLAITGPVTNVRTEGAAPYALFGDSGGNYAGVQFPQGAYTVSATAYSGPNLSGSILGTVTVQFAIVQSINQPPIAVATATPLTGSAPLIVNFNGSLSTDDAPGLSYEWNFGDGSTLSNLVNPTHQYSVAGSYTASLKVTDAEGLSDTETVVINVQQVVQNVISLTLVDSDTDLDFLTLQNNQQVSLATVLGKNLNIRADVNVTSAVGSVGMSLVGPLSTTRIEGVAPYALYGDINGNYNGVAFPIGNYSVSAIAYSGSNLSGVEIGRLTLSFSIVNSSSGKSTTSSISSNTVEQSSQVIETNMENGNVGLYLFPNPASTSVEIRVPQNSQDISSIAMYSYNGTLVRVYNRSQIRYQNGAVKLDMTGASNGVYLLSVETPSSGVRVMKLIIQN